jgi:hypothetical protein
MVALVVVEGAYRQSDHVVGLASSATRPERLPLTQGAQVSGAEGFLGLLRERRERNWWNIGGWGNTEHAIEFNQNSLGRHVPGGIETNRWYDIRVELKDRSIRCYLDGKLIHDEAAALPQRFFALAGQDAAGDVTIKVINAAGKPVSASVGLGGTSSLPASAQLTSLRIGLRQTIPSMPPPGSFPPRVQFR